MEMIEKEEQLRPKVWGFWATIGFALIIGVILFVIEMIIIGVFAAASIINSNIEITDFVTGLMTNGLLLSVTTIVAAVIGSGLVLILIKVRRGLSIAEYLGFKPITVKTGLVMLGITAVFIIITDVFSIVFKMPSSPDFMVDAYKTSVWPALFWLAIVVLGPFFEEIIFRGFLFTGFSRSKIGIPGTIILTSLGWSLLHVQYNFYEMGIIFVLGIIMGIVRFKTGSLWSVITIHVLFNLSGMLIIALNANNLIPT